MQFTKNKRMSIATVLIVIVVYNVVVFVIPFNRGGGFWTGYGFSMMAMLLTASVGFYAFNREGIKSKFYGMPLLSVAWRYMIIQLIVGLVEMVVQFIPFQYGIALNTVLLGFCLIGLIAVDMGKEEIERIDEKIKEKVFYIKSLQADVEGLVDKTTDDSTRKLLNDLVETITYSDPMSNPQLSSVENKIDAKASVLMEAVKNREKDEIGSLCNELQVLFNERNRKCKILK